MTWFNEEEEHFGSVKSQFKRGYPLFDMVEPGCINFTGGSINLVYSLSEEDCWFVYANILYDLYKKGKRSLVITQRSSIPVLLKRVACVHLGKKYNSSTFATRFQPNYKGNNNVSIHEFENFIEHFKESVVFSCGEPASSVELVRQTIEDGASYYDCIFIDKYLSIDRCIQAPNFTIEEVRFRFKRMLKESTLKKSMPPIVLINEPVPMGYSCVNRRTEQVVDFMSDIYDVCNFVIDVRRSITDNKETCYDFYPDVSWKYNVGRVERAYVKGGQLYFNISLESNNIKENFNKLNSLIFDEPRANILSQDEVCQ